MIDFPDKGDLRHRSGDFAEAILRLSAGCWRPGIGLVTMLPFKNRVEDHRRGEVLAIGWRTYLGQAAAIQQLPTDADAELIPPGGALVRLHGDFDPADPDQIREACRIRDSLRGHATTSFARPNPRSLVEVC